jgi:chromosome partitioning protein
MAEPTELHDEPVVENAVYQQNGVGLDELNDLVDRCQDTLSALRSLGMTPNNEKRLMKFYRARKVADMVGFSRTKVTKAIDELGLVQASDPETQRPLGYSLAQVNQIRDALNARPGRQPHEAAVRLAVQSFKGGVAKSVTTVYIAQYLAEKGYRVLVVDCDPQASATQSFGYVPDHNFKERHTLSPALHGEEDTLEYAIIPTYFDGIDLVPSCLALNEVDFAIYDAVARAETQERDAFYHLVEDAVATVQDRYDVILMDSAPNLSMMSINILVAANAVVVPAPPAIYDFSSTSQYLQMVSKVMTGIAPGKRYEFLKVMPSKVDRSKSKMLDFLAIMQDKFGNFLLGKPFLYASAIPDTASYFQTVFDQAKPDHRVMTMLNGVLGEIEVEICKTWPSRHEALREKGVLL